VLLLTFAGDFYALSDGLKRQFKQQVVVASVTRIDPSFTRGINATVELLPGSVLARVTYAGSITQRDVGMIRSSIEAIPVVVAVGDRVYVSGSSMVLVESRIIDANTGLEVGGSQIVRIEGGGRDDDDDDDDVTDGAQTTAAGGTNHTVVLDDGTTDLQAETTSGDSQQTLSLSSAAIYVTIFLLLVVLVVLVTLQWRQKSYAHPVRYKMQQHPALSLHDGSLAIDQFDDDHWIHIPDGRTPHKGAGMYVPSPAPSVLFSPDGGRMVRVQSGAGSGSSGAVLFSPDGGRMVRVQSGAGSGSSGTVLFSPDGGRVGRLPSAAASGASRSSGAALSYRNHTNPHPSTFLTGLSGGSGTDTDHNHIGRVEQHPGAGSWDQRPGVNLGTQHTWGSDADWGDGPIDLNVFQDSSRLSPVSPVDVNMTASPARLTAPAYSEAGFGGAGEGAGEYLAYADVGAFASAGEYLSSHGPGEYLNLRSQSRTSGTQSPSVDAAGFPFADRHLFFGPDGPQTPRTRADYLRNVASPQHNRRRQIQATMLQNSEMLDIAVGDVEETAEV